MEERRKQPRVNVMLPVTYACFHDNGKSLENRIGIVLNVSLNGMLLGSETIIDAKYVKLVFVSYDNKKSRIVGYVVNSRRNENGRVNTGLSFHGEKAEISSFVANLVRTYHYRKKDPSQTLQNMAHSAIGI
jgi:hypothetical protein